MCGGAEADRHTYTHTGRANEREREERESKVQEGLRFSGRRKYVRQNLILLNTMTQIYQNTDAKRNRSVQKTIQTSSAGRMYTPDCVMLSLYWIEEEMIFFVCKIMQTFSLYCCEKKKKLICFFVGVVYVSLYQIQI